MLLYAICVLFYTILCYFMLFYAILCYSRCYCILFCAILCYFMLFYAILNWFERPSLMDPSGIASNSIMFYPCAAQGILLNFETPRDDSRTRCAPQYAGGLRTNVTPSVLDASGTVTSAFGVELCSSKWLSPV